MPGARLGRRAPLDLGFAGVWQRAGRRRALIERSTVAVVSCHNGRGAAERNALSSWRWSVGAGCICLLDRERRRR